MTFRYYRIVETDNLGRDYPGETFVESLPAMTKEQAQAVARAINDAAGEHSLRYWKVVDNEYRLEPGMEALMDEPSEEDDRAAARCLQCDASVTEVYECSNGHVFPMHYLEKRS